MTSLISITIFIMFIKILFNYQGERTRYQAWPSAKDLFYPLLAMPTTPHSKKQQNHTNIECSVYLMFKVCCLSVVCCCVWSLALPIKDKIDLWRLAMLGIGSVRPDN
jgi:hypothetical protein